MKKGISASKGYAIGQVFIKETTKIIINENKIEDASKETARLNKAVETSRTQLKKIKAKALKELGADKAEVFESHIMLLDDPEFVGAMVTGIENNMVNAEKALTDTLKMFIDIFEAMDDDYMRERAADVKDVGGRILANLRGHNIDILTDLPENTIVVANDLTPSDTAQLDKDKVIAFLTNIGGRTSHTAIMARTLEIPAVVGLKDITNSVKNGDTVIVDGSEGVVIINPSKTVMNEYLEKKSLFEKEKVELLKLKNIKTVTKSGKRVEVGGNIGKANDVNKVLENGGEAIGLFRTEFLYMDRDSMPTEDEQFTAYKYVAEKMGEKPVVIRTLDIGGDKKLSYLPMPEEMNPFLGYRAIRICLDRTDIFKVQLRALLRASAFGNVKIMFPMISSLDEFVQAKAYVKECMKELKTEGIKFNEKLEIGIMIEIPAAAVMADELAKHVDFFSIGTNDLIQYTLAIDRVDDSVNYLYDPLHPAVLRLIKTSIDGANKLSKPISMCGEMASDSRYVRLLLGLGLRGFSVNPESYLEVKQIITTTDMGNLEKLANRMLKTSSHLDMAHLLELINAH